MSLDGKKYRPFFTAALILIILLPAGCGGARKQTTKVSASGSSALLPLLKAGQEDFQNMYKDVSVSLSAGGSFTGQNQAAAGYVDIGSSDVELQASLKDKGLREYILAGIPFVFIVNRDVPVNSLTARQYADIFSGGIINWKEVGGRDRPVTVVGRPFSSGSRAAITGLVMQNKKFTDNQIIFDSNGAVRAAVGTTPGAIGYIDAAYVDDSVKELAYDGEKYSVENIIAGKYPIYALGRLYTRGEPKGAVKDFIDFVLSEGFQNKHVAKNGFIPPAKLKNNRQNRSQTAKN
ncbi:MAG: phosphate ABC transporter substrate-binding protein [Acidaminococcales bacterium]|nr:phosphate ABC transporter substrate-binding protein [Acidaminococcales bacterium]